MVYPQIIKKNIKKVLGLVNDADILRPHVKTHKMVEVAKLNMIQGINKFKCATIAEAEMLAIAGC